MEQMKSKIVGLLIAVVAVTGCIVIPGLATADESCNSGHVCAWENSFYGAGKTEVLCTFGQHGVGTRFSAKNRCANKAAKLFWFEGETFNEKACMNPGGNRPEPGRFNSVDVLTEGSHC